MIGDCEAPETCSDGQADICERPKQGRRVQSIEIRKTDMREATKPEEEVVVVVMVKEEEEEEG